MFALRGIAVSLTFFVLLYCFLSALVAASWRSLRWLRTTKKNLAGWLFTLRILPLVAASAITVAFVIPSFQLLEPRYVDEGLGAKPIVLGACALFLIIVGSVRVIRALTTTSRVVARWLGGARLHESGAQTITFRSQNEAPPLTLVGVRRPKVLVSDATVAVLSSGELQIALKHELAHMQSRDNLKRLIFRFCPFPGMSTLESAWSQTAELAADDAAVSKLDDAIELASALVKLSRLVPAHPSPVCTVGFVTGSITTRVARLLAWDETPHPQSFGFRARYSVGPLLLTLLCVVATYQPMLVCTHEITEWLVR